MGLLFVYRLVACLHSQQGIFVGSSTSVRPVLSLFSVVSAAREHALAGIQDNVIDDYAKPHAYAPPANRGKARRASGLFAPS